MIKQLSHCTFFVTDQDDAHHFYTEKLGFEVRTDNTLEGFRWLTVGPREQKDLEIVLMAPKAGGMYDEATIEKIRELQRRGVFGAGVFRTDDCHKTYDELKARGVEFTQEPQERPYGIEALFRDPSGNWFSLCQPRPH
ncbi:MAG: VOC family protein [Nannocystaceae bacterium]